MLPPTPPVNTFLLPLSFLPGDCISSPCGDEFPAFSKARGKVTVQGHLGIHPAASPGRGSDLADTEFGYQTRRTDCLKLFRETHGTDHCVSSPLGPWKKGLWNGWASQIQGEAFLQDKHFAGPLGSLEDRASFTGRRYMYSYPEPISSNEILCPRLTISALPLTVQ